MYQLIVFSLPPCRLLPILYFHLGYDTDNSTLKISQYQYKSNTSTLHKIHTFNTYFVVCKKAAPSDINQTRNKIQQQ